MTKENLETKSNTAQTTSGDQLDGLTLMDNGFANMCFENDIPALELVLRTILKKPDLAVESVKTTTWDSNPQNTSLSIAAHDSKGKEYLMEVFINPAETSGKFAGYVSKKIDYNFIMNGGTEDTFPDSYVIFILDHDPFGKGRSVYKFGKTEMNTGIPFNDGTHILYVNGEFLDESSVGQLMQDFCCTDPEKMHHEKLARCILEVKKQN